MYIYIMYIYIIIIIIINYYTYIYIIILLDVIYVMNGGGKQINEQRRTGRTHRHLD